MSSFVLKIIALVTMILDHVGAELFPQYEWLRYVGRLSFPIYAFLIAQGFAHTSDRKRYAIRLGAFALISEVPHDLLFYNTWLEFGYQNIMFELLFGFLAIWCIDKAIKEKKYLFLVIVPILVVSTAILNFSYDIYGMVLIIVAYLFVGKDVASGLGSAVTTYCFNGFIQAGFKTFGRYIPVLTYNPAQVFAVLAAIPIMFYNGKRGKYSLKWFFYISYPAHLLLLWVIKILLFT